MFKRLIIFVLLLLAISSYVDAEERNVLLVLSRDVKRVVYDIYSVDPASLEYKRILSNGLSPLYSPDGQKIAFVSRVPIEGDEYSYILSLCISNVDGSQIKKIKQHTHGVNILDLSWSPDGKKIAFATGKSIAITNLDGEIMSHTGKNKITQVDWLGDNERVVFEEAQGGISLFDLRTQKVKVVSSRGNFTKILPGTNKLVYLKKNDKVKMLIKDLDTCKEKVVANNVLVTTVKKSVYVISKDGKKIFFLTDKGNSEGVAQLRVYNLASKSISSYKDFGGFLEAVSYDGTKVAGIFKFGDKLGYGIIDLKTKKRSMIREIKNDEMDEQIFLIIRLMEW
jgi:Tol biopolymer transport system component